MLKLFNYNNVNILMNSINNIFANYIDIFKLSKLSVYTFLRYTYLLINYKYFNKSIENFKFKRYYLIQSICEKLLQLNVNYLKIVQSMCLHKDFLNKQEQEYLIKYTNNVPFSKNEIDIKLINFLKEQNITFDCDEPVNSGVSALVYKGKFNNKKIAIKILKKNAEINMYNCLSTIEIIINAISFLPFLKNLNLKNVFRLNKKVMLEQLDLINEKNNLLKFYESYDNYDYIKIPNLYNIDNNKYNNKFILLEFIDGFTINKLLEINNHKLNEIFGEKILKFGLLSILMTSCIHCDLHPGNFILNIKDINNNKILNNKEIETIFFRDNENINYNNFEFILNIIDFGLATFPNKETQYIYYQYFDQIFVKNDYLNAAEYTLNNLIEKLNGDKSFNCLNFENAKNEIYKLLKSYHSKDYDLEIFYNINKIINKYGFKFKDEMLKIQISLSISCHMTKNLLGQNGINLTTRKLMNELYKINEIINFD